MNEAEFYQRWHAEKAMYDAWGQYVVDFISSSLTLELCKDLKSYLKIPACHRVKEDDSLIDKAFYRDKNYADPYNDIEDKVGARFVVMLVSDVEDICDVIKKAAEKGVWDAVHCRNFNKERNQSPMLFTYQSHHFIIRSNKSFVFNDIEINEKIPCEVQVRSLLQHAYAELTHDATYKKKTIVEPDVIRTVAKTMAFIETADDFFQHVSEKTESKSVLNAERFLDPVFEKITGSKSIKLNSTITIYDAFQSQINNDFEMQISNFLSRNPGLGEVIKGKMSNNKFYNQSVVIFVCWLIRRRKSIVESEWPLEWRIVSDIAVELGVALNRES